MRGQTGPELANRGKGRGARKLRFIHVQGNADLEARLAAIRAENAARSAPAMTAIEQAARKREARAARRAVQECGQ